MRRLITLRLPVVLVCVMTALLVSVGAQAASAAPPGRQIACQPGQPCAYWGVMTTANPGLLGNNFFATAVLSSSDAWAAGWKYELLPSTGRRPKTGPKQGCGCAHYALIEHWNGATWSVVPHPDDTLRDSQISGMAAIASNDVWAVGYSIDPITGYIRNLIEHWNGSAWSAVPSATFPQAEQLLAVAGRATDDVWAVGTFYDGSDPSNQHFSTEIKHWNGVSWSVVPSPNATVAGNSVGGWLTSVTAFASNNVWAVGYSVAGTLIEHWDGAQWSIVSSPNTSAQQNQLFGVGGSAANDVWAVGSFYDQTGGPSGGPLIEHWDGASWSIVSATADPITTHDQLLGVAAPRAGEAWAVGELTDNPNIGSSTPLLQSWNGLVWSAQPTPPLGASGFRLLTAVGAAADGTVIAVGYYPDPGNGNDRTLAMLLGRRPR